jgi:hypothetical protein
MLAILIWPILAPNWHFVNPGTFSGHLLQQLEAVAHRAVTLGARPRTTAPARKNKAFAELRYL